MRPEALLAALADLAQEAGLRVRHVGRGEPELPSRSGVCRLRGGVFVILAHGDSLEDQIDVLCRALRDHCGPQLEGRYLPPAIRGRLEGPSRLA